MKLRPKDKHKTKPSSLTKATAEEVSKVTGGHCPFCMGTGEANEQMAEMFLARVRRDLMVRGVGLSPVAAIQSRQSRQKTSEYLVTPEGKAAVLPEPQPGDQPEEASGADSPVSTDPEV
jgi:hypothetical protein